MHDTPYFPDMERSGWETYPEVNNGFVELEFTKSGRHDVRFSIFIPYEDDRKAYECITDLADNYWGKFSVSDCVNAIRGNSSCFVHMKTGGAVGVDFTDLDIDPETLINGDIVKLIAGYTTDIDKGLDILKDEVEVFLDKSAANHKISRKETIPVADDSMVDTYEEIKNKLENSLIFQDLRNNHGWAVESFIQEDGLYVNMAKEGPLNSMIVITFPYMYGDEFSDIKSFVGDLRPVGSGSPSLDKCIIAAIRGDVFLDTAYSSYRIFNDQITPDKSTIAINFGGDKELIDSMSISQITDQVKEISREILTASKCLNSDDLDTPEMVQLIDYLDKNQIAYTREIDLKDGVNKVNVNDKDLGLHFSVRASRYCYPDEHSFCVSDGLIFNHDDNFRQLKSEDGVLFDDLINRLKSVEKPIGFFRFALEDLNVYGFSDEGEHGSVLMGLNRNDAILYPIVSYGEDCYGNTGLGYQYNNVFLPAHEMQQFCEEITGYGAPGKDVATVEKDDFPEPKQNTRSGVVGSRLIRNNRILSQSDTDKNHKEPKGHSNPERRE